MAVGALNTMERIARAGTVLGMGYSAVRAAALTQQLTVAAFEKLPRGCKFKPEMSEGKKVTEDVQVKNRKGEVVKDKDGNVKTKKRTVYTNNPSWFGKGGDKVLSAGHRAAPHFIDVDGNTVSKKQNLAVGAVTAIVSLAAFEGLNKVLGLRTPFLNSACSTFSWLRGKLPV